MIGRLEIDRLRRDAESRLGSRFSVGEFHDTVLGNGMIPLPELARTVDAWISTLLRTTPSEIDAATEHASGTGVRRARRTASHRSARRHSDAGRHDHSALRLDAPEWETAVVRSCWA